jgi:hypothetical protein
VPSLAAPLVPLPLLLCSIVEKRLKDIFISVEELAGIAQMLREEKALKSTAPEANVTRQELRQQVRKGALPGKLFESSFYSSFRSARGGAGVRTTAGSPALTYSWAYHIRARKRVNLFMEMNCVQESGSVISRV